MIEQIRLFGVYTFESIFPDGRSLKQEYKNAITQNYFTAVHSLLNYSGMAPDADILNLTHIAFGENDTPATRNDSLLVDEKYRKIIANKSSTLTLFTVRTTLAAGEWNPTGGIIKEAGVFAKATDALNNGTMISRAAVSVQKNENIQLIITWELRQV